MSDFFELTGNGYNIMTRKANRYGKFQMDLVLTDPDQIKEAEQLELKYGLKLKDTVTFSKDGKPQELKGVTAVTLTAKYVEDGKFPRKFIPMTKADTGDEITDLIAHGAKLTVRFKKYQFKPGVTSDGHSYSGGFGFQMENIIIHEYTPYKSAA